MAPLTLFLGVSAILCQTILAVNVFDAMKSSNAGLFAQWIQQDPSLEGLYNSTQVKTVFAPDDAAFQSYNQSGKLPELRRLLTRAFIPTEQGLQQACAKQDGMNAPHPPEGDQYDTQLPSANPNRNQPVILAPPSPSQGNGTSSRRKRQSKKTFQFQSGLGNTVSVVRADIPYDGGLLHTLDGFFTIPQSWETTFASTNASSFYSGLTKTNLTSLLQNPAGATCFSTQDELYHNSFQPNTSTATLLKTLSNHVIPNFIGYTSSLTNGTVLTTQSGNNLTVTFKNGEWFINQAKIIAPNQITSFGVAHIVDSLIVPSSTPSVPLSTGMAASYTATGKGSAAAAIGCMLLAWLI